MAKVIVNDLVKHINFVDKPINVLTASGNLVVKEIKKNWAAGKGADGSSLKSLTTPYQNYKRKRGGSSIADMNLTGKMKASLNTRKKNSTAVIVGVSAGQEPKLEGNVSKRSNIMAVGNNLTNIITNYLTSKLKAL